MQGTYITTTNLTEEDKKRIKKLHLGPFYISVHTTNPDLRVKMLKNPNAAKIMDNLKWFCKNDIPFHVQIVLCPGYNDGEELKRTLKDLSSLGKNFLSAAIVPVGVTQFRSEKLRTVDEKIAEETLQISSRYKKVCCSDEFFILAGKSIPKSDYYGSFAQLDDGVGSLRILTDDFDSLALPQKLKNNLNITFACSVASQSAFIYISEKLNKIQNLTCNIKPVKSTYWGENITVAGLITSDDLINSIISVTSDVIFVPQIMLKPYTELFLDGKSLDYVKEKTGKNIIVIQDNYSIAEAIDYISSFAD